MMFIILLTYTKPLSEVDLHLPDQKGWVERGFDDGVFVLSGGQRPRMGGAIIALGNDRAIIEARIQQDPFVFNSVATAQIIEIIPSTVDERVSLLRAT